MPDPVASAPAAPPSPAPAPAPDARPGSLTGTRYDAPARSPTDSEFDRLPVREQGRYARVRDEANNPRWTLRSDDPGAPKPAAAPAPGEPAPPAPTPAASVVDAKLRIGEGETAYELSADDVKMLMAQKAESDLHKTQIPASPEGYELKLPEAFKVPDGIQFEFNAADPVMAAKRGAKCFRFMLRPKFGRLRHSKRRRLARSRNSGQWVKQEFPRSRFG
jgi:hypothetical protein